MAIPANAVTAIIGPSGCGKSTLLRTINRIYELYPDQYATGEIVIDGRNVLDRRYPLSDLRRLVGMVFQKPTPFPSSIRSNVAFALSYYERLSKSELNDRIEDALRQAALWDEVKDKLNQSALVAVGRPAAAAVHRAHDRRPARDHPAGRADLGARSDLHREDRGADPRAARALHDRHRHAQHAAGGARVAAHRLLPPRRADRIRQARATSSPTRASSAPRTISPAATADRSRSCSKPANIRSRPSTRISSGCARSSARWAGSPSMRSREAMRCLVQRDVEGAAQVVEDDKKLDALEIETERRAVQLIALRAPMAGDLRDVVAALKISGVVERIGDYAKNIAKRVPLLENVGKIEPLVAAPGNGADRDRDGPRRARRLRRARCRGRGPRVRARRRGRRFLQFASSARCSPT